MHNCKTPLPWLSLNQNNSRSIHLQSFIRANSNDSLVHTCVCSIFGMTENISTARINVLIVTRTCSPCKRIFDYYFCSFHTLRNTWLDVIRKTTNANQMAFSLIPTNTAECIVQFFPYISREYNRFRWCLIHWIYQMSKSTNVVYSGQCAQQYLTGSQACH